MAYSVSQQTKIWPMTKAKIRQKIELYQVQRQYIVTPNRATTSRLTKWTEESN